MKIKIISSLCIFALLTFSCPAVADVSPLRQGQAASYDGLLISPGDAASIMADKKILPDIIAAEVKKTKDLAGADCKLKMSEQDISARQNSAVLSAQVKSLMDSNSALSNQLNDAQNREKWIPIYVGGAAIVGVAIGVLTTTFVTKITKN